VVEKEVKVANSLGIHARPASLIVQSAAKFKCSLSLEKDGVTADAKSIMSVMMLAAGNGAAVLIRGSGSDEKEAVEAIAAIFESNFNEE
jgi:phosphocarrier protein HPr